MALPAKQRIFVEEYLRCWNATEAARRAGYSHPNVQGPRLLVNVSISEEIQLRVDEAAMSANEVLLRLAQQARAEYSIYFTPEGNVDLARLLADGKGHLIKGIKETQYGRTVEFYDGQAALIQIGKIHGLFTEKIEHDGEVVIRVEYGEQRSGGSPSAAPSETD